MKTKAWKPEGDLLYADGFRAFFGIVGNGGGMIGPDEHTLRQIEREQAKKRERREAAHRIAVGAAEKHWRLAAIHDIQYWKAEVV